MSESVLDVLLCGVYHGIVVVSVGGWVGLPPSPRIYLSINAFCIPLGASVCFSCRSVSFNDDEYAASDPNKKCRLSVPIVSEAELLCHEHYPSTPDTDFSDLSLPDDGSDSWEEFLLSDDNGLVLAEMSDNVCGVDFGVFPPDATPRPPVGGWQAVFSEESKTLDLHTAKFQKHSTASSPTDIVGPRSYEMSIIYRMVVYLQESGGDNCKILETFRKTIQHCDHLHTVGRTFNCRNLPGLIFDELVEHLGGETFSMIFYAAKVFQHPLVDDMYRTRENAENDTEALSLLQLILGKTL